MLMLLARRARRRALHWFALARRPAAWLLLVGAALTFVGVLVNLISVGVAKWATLLIAADLLVSGFDAVQEAEDDEQRAAGS